MKTLNLLTTFSLGLAFVASANALTFSDVDVDGNEGEPSYLYMASWGTSSWNKTFNLLNAGFDPETMKVVSAVVSFAFADNSWDINDDNQWREEYVTLSIGSETLWSWLEVDGSHDSPPGSYDWYSKSVGDDVLVDLQDGLSNYSVQANWGNFYLKEASLVAEVEHLKVPDTGATLGLLGIGVATLLILRRQMLKGKDA